MSGGRTIPIIADEAVDPLFGTGALKITPGEEGGGAGGRARTGRRIVWSMFGQAGRQGGRRAAGGRGLGMCEQGQACKRAKPVMRGPEAPTQPLPPSRLLSKSLQFFLEFVGTGSTCSLAAPPWPPLHEFLACHPTPSTPLAGRRP